jgi:carbamoyl-phosphate synthase large subunit
VSTDRALVTGGAGVIGRALVERLVAAGVLVRCLDVQPPPPWLPGAVEYVQGDLRVLDGSWITSFDPHVVYHLAATFERSEESPGFWRESAEHNVVVSRRVLDAAIGAPSLRRVVFASSYLVYDTAMYLLASPPDAPRPLEEGSPISPRNVCGAAKLLHEHELDQAERDAHAAPDGAGFTTVSARIFRVYGRGSRDVVGRWVRGALAGEKLVAYGTESFFDYVYADDVADGLVRLAASGVTGAVNLGSGRSRRVADVVGALRSALDGVDIEVVDENPHGTWEASQAATARLEAATGWTPPTALEEGVDRVVAYERGEAATTPALRRRVIARPHTRVLVTSLSRKAPIVRGFREAFLALSLPGEVHGADGDDLAAARVDVDRFWPMPRLDSLADGALVEWVVEHGADLVVPTRDGELLRFAAVREALEERGVLVAVGDAPAVEACLDKLAFASACAAAGLPVIPTAQSVDELGGGVVSFVAKERRGAGSRSLGLDLDRAAAATHGGSLDEAVYQPFVEGPELSVDVYRSRHEGAGVVGAVVRTRDRVMGGESQVTSLVVDRPDVAELAVSAVTALGLHGHAVLQVIDADGGPVLVECNARIGGASALSFAVGLKTPQYLLQEMLGEPPTPLRLAPPPARLLRRPDDVVAAIG